MLRAILVDDEDLSVRMLESIVDWRRYGVEITATARSGKDALRLFSELRPELMVTDIRMPGMDGIELLRCVKEMEPRTEFILVSAYADFEYAKEAIALGSAYYLLKPVDEFELERAIKKIADKIGAQQATQRLLESTHRQKELLTLYSYMRTGAGKAAAQKSAGRLSVCFEQYALIGFMLNESSMNAYIENSFQLDTQLPYLQARLEEQLRCWCDCLLFDFFDASWCAVLLNAGVSLLDCAEALVAFFTQELHMEVHVCFTELEHGLETLPNSFNLLQRLNQYSFFLGEEVILGYGYNCERGEFDQVALAAARKAMENAIRESNPSKARKVLDEALSSLDHTTPSSLEFVYDFCYAGVKAVRESLPGSTKPELQEKLMKVTSQSVRNCATLDELRRFMEEVLEVLPGEEPAEHVYSQLVQDGMAYLQENYDRNLSLEEICSALGVSRNYFCYLFKKETGQNLWEY